MAECFYKVTGVSYAYPAGIQAVAQLDLSIEKGECCAVIGANGTGKSTLLTMLDALIFPSEGTIEALGKNLTAKMMNDAEFQRCFRREVGFVFQNPDVQLFCPTVREDIAFAPLHLGVEKAEIRRRIDAVSERLRIGDLLDRSPYCLSVGEKKKVAIASVLAVAPAVLLLDEPTAGLDPRTTSDIIDVILAEREAGITVVMASHDLHVVAATAQTVHVFGASRSVVRTGSAREVLSDRDFLVANNLAHPRRDFHGDEFFL
jgi:cobalt/nickel transport system ATP-binding protein